MNQSEVNTLPTAEVLRAWVDQVTRIPGEDDALLRRLSDDYARARDTDAGALVIALVGSTGAGKSTLLNALAGAAVAEEGEVRPTSTVPVVYAPEDAMVGSLAAFGVRVARYPVLPGGAWSGQVFVDTPDFNSVAREHRGRAEAVLEAADVAVVVLHKGSVVEAVSVEALAGFARRRRLIFAVNFGDELSPDSREALKAQVRDVASERLGVAAQGLEVFAISARSARIGQDPTGEWAGFLGALATLGGEAGREKVRRSNAMGLLREIADRIRPRLAAIDRAAEEVGGALGRGLEAAGAEFREDFDRRLEAARPHLAIEVRKRGGARWWGPAAWWMRLSSLGAGGLGAATLVARGSLPVGLAMAAASTALVKVREHTLASAADRELVTSEDPRLIGAVSAAVASARAAARQQGLEPESIGVPADETLLTMLQSSREAAWRYTGTGAIEDVVARWWGRARWLLIPLINLPLLALLGQVAVMVVRAWIEGRYLGGDFFLNAAAMALVIAAVGGMLATISLQRAIRRVAQLGRTRFEVLLRLGLDQLVAGPPAAFAELREPAAHLIRAAEAFDGTSGPLALTE